MKTTDGKALKQWKYPLKCEYCQAPFGVQYPSHLGRRFCGPKCAKLNHCYNGGWAQHMRKHNPMRKAASRKKMRETLLRIKHRPKIRGGNGRPAPKAQVKLMEILALVFPEQTIRIEYAVPIPQSSRTNFPSHYKIDCAIPALKIAVEADGPSHQVIARMKKDRKKDAKLRRLGWRVFRFQNEIILSNPLKVLETLKLRGTTTT